MDDFTVVDNADLSRFEARTDDGTVLGFIDYRPARHTGEDSSPADVVMTHAEVDDEVEGQGIGTRLAREALDQVRASGRGVMPLCAFVQAFIAEHPDYQDLVRTEQDRGQGG
ncbi:GNAT family N-acetyltransferase [Cellulomonas aerilata]|uniref:N-acetyltransferase n=1 Tax=Cellulomonas aerilata TaxID=515326 RepID=A0A512D7I6_9CELL|nr:GNAT family N-acetyltransferase [Cellulomonas aerilata]GEO32357.1 N-acetyltransferase [Cellulomonas aerilata]